MLRTPDDFAVPPKLMINSDYGRNDALSDVLQTIRLHGGEVNRVSCSDTGSPGGGPEHFEYPSGARMLHIVESGPIQVSLSTDEHIEHIELLGGDMVVLARGDKHRIGAKGAACWVSGEFMVEPLVADPLLSVLTPAIVIRGGDEGTRWLPFSVNLILEELTKPGPGSRVMVARLIELLFIRALRAWAASGDRAEPGWLTAAMDPQLSPVLTAIHRSPERDWSVEELAGLAAMSRSAFAGRFTALLGQPPGTYVLHQRLEHAAHLLRSTGEPVGRIAAIIGYNSEAAFSRAFTRAHGQSPRAWRTAQTQADRRR